MRLSCTCGCGSPQTIPTHEPDCALVLGFDWQAEQEQQEELDALRGEIYLLSRGEL